MGTDAPTAPQARRGPRHGLLAAQLAVLWESSVCADRYRKALAERVGDDRLRARLMVLAAFSRAHASRLLARLDAMGRGPLPVPPTDMEPIGPDVVRALRAAAEATTTRMERFLRCVETATRAQDLSSAWVCNLNHVEESDAARELLGMAKALEARKGTAA